MCPDSQIEIRKPVCGVSGEPSHTGLCVLPLQLSHKYTPGTEGVGGGVGGISASSPCPPANSRPASLLDFLASPALEDDNVPQIEGNNCGR